MLFAEALKPDTEAVARAGGEAEPDPRPGFCAG
jgi:hypothetical protein